MTQFEITITEEGDIVVCTTDLTGSSHIEAERFLKELDNLADTNTTIRSLRRIPKEEKV